MGLIISYLVLKARKMKKIKLQLDVAIKEKFNTFFHIFYLSNNFYSLLI